MATGTKPDLRVLKVGDPVHVRAQQAWLILVHCAKNQRTITYGELAELMGYDRQAARATIKPLAAVAYFCQKADLPQLNAIVVNADSGEPGESVVLGSDSAGTAQRKVHQFDWFSVRVPSPGAFRAVWEEFS